MSSPQDSTEGRTPNPTPPREPPTQGERGTAPRHEARPERPAKFTEHLDDDDPAHAFEYSETWKLLQESETTSETPEAGPSTPNRSVFRRKSRKESRIIQQTGSRSPREPPITPLQPSLLSPMASQVPQPPLFSRSRASTNPPRRAFEGPRPLTEDKLPFEGSSESDQTPRSAQKQPLHSATSHRKIPVTRAPDEPSPFSPRVIVPTITVSSPNQPIPPLPESLGEVRFSGVHQSRQTVRTFSNADGSLRRHLSFRRKPARGSNNPPSSSAAPAPGDVDNGELGDVDTNDEDSGPIPGLTMRKEQVRRRMANYYASASASGSGSGSGSVRPLPRALEEDFEPFGYWDGEDFYEWPDRDWLGRPRGSRPVSPVSSGKDNDKGKAASGSVLSKVWRKLTVKDRKRKGKGKEKEKEKTRVPKWRSRKEYHMELQSYREWQAQVAGGGVIFDGHEAERDRRSTMGIWTASSSNDGDNEGDESLGPSTATNSFPSQPGDKKKKQGESFIDFVTRLLQKK